VRAGGKPNATADAEDDDGAEVLVVREVESNSGRAARPEAVSISSMLLRGLKEELFELEVEHKQGRISQQEYEKSKAALDHTLQRALTRESQKA
jgi:DNA repair ATPase RecN